MLPRPLRRYFDEDTALSGGRCSGQEITIRASLKEPLGERPSEGPGMIVCDLRLKRGHQVPPVTFGQLLRPSASMMSRCASVWPRWPTRYLHKKARKAFEAAAKEEKMLLPRDWISEPSNLHSMSGTSPPTKRVVGSPYSPTRPDPDRIT